jgi:hypothetical protein
MQNQSAHAARPGAINYVEGDAAIDNQPLNPDVVGSVELQKGQMLSTQAGKVEILLTPGVFLRVADNSTVKMVSPDLANTEVELDKGRAMAEVTDISKNNNRSRRSKRCVYATAEKRPIRLRRGPQPGSRVQREGRCFPE